MTENTDSRRLDLVRAAQQRWIAALTDLGGRNTLLYYKDRRASTLDLAQADPEAMDRFTGTGSIRLTVVSSFSSHDVDPERLTKAGARLLADYLEYAGSGGTPVAADGAGAADAFEASVRSRLAGYGITVVPQYGVGGYRVDFAAAHPDDPSRMILAVEADGASYRDSGSVRDRDRLRKEHLERLGWRFHRLWSTNWFHDPDTEVARLREAYEKAVAASPPPAPFEPPQPPRASAPPARAARVRSSRRPPSCRARLSPGPPEPPGPLEPPGPFEPPPPAPPVPGPIDPRTPHHLCHHSSPQNRGPLQPRPSMAAAPMAHWCRR